MTDITSRATQGHFGEVTSRIVSLATQGIYQELEAPKILALEIEISSSKGEIEVFSRDGIAIVGTRRDIKIE